MRSPVLGPGLDTPSVDVLTEDLAARLADALVGMGADQWWDTWDRESLLQPRPEKWERSLLVVQEGRPRAYAIVSRTGQAAHLHHIVVAPDARGLGLGSWLVSELLRRNTDVDELTLKVHPENDGAQRLYRRLGFEDRGRSPSGYVQMARIRRSVDPEEKSMRVAVHQPNYMPWCGFFAKMFACDAFVLFDDTQLPQGRSYVSRAKIAKGKDDEQWLTVPIQKSGRKAIRDVPFAEPGWASAHLRTLHHAYARARYAEEAMDLVRPLYEDPGETLAEFNSRAIETIGRYLGWEGAFHRSSDHPADLLSDRRLAQLVRAVGGTVYVSGAGGQNYQSEDVFAGDGLELEVRTYRPKPYERSGSPFVPGLSILDAVFHLGREARHVLAYDADATGNAVPASPGGSAVDVPT
jgi:GNAT superfamily N-acetyltransferase